MAFRSVKEFLDLGGSLAPTPAERAVIRAVQAGEPCLLSEERPEAATPDNTVRATLLRLLVTWATPDCGTLDYGVWVEGAWITGVLDLGYAKARGRTVLDACHFEAAPKFPDADLNQLSLDGSHLPGLFAQGLRLRGSLFLRGVKAKGTVDVGGAKIGGQLSCVGPDWMAPRRTANGAWR